MVMIGDECGRGSNCKGESFWGENGKRLWLSLKGGEGKKG